ncbi:MAG: universal stress protein [Chitinophagales bacterium]
MKHIPITKILVPVDFSETSGHFTRVAAAIAKRHQASLILIHVFEPFYESYRHPMSGIMERWLDEVKKMSSERLAVWISEISEKYGIECSYDFMIGNVCDLISYSAESNNCSLIVMGTHGTSGFREYFIGSNAYRMVKYAPCPVLTVPNQNSPEKFGTILFPVRLVPHALDKYYYVRSIAKKNDSTLHVLGLIDSKSPERINEMKAQLAALEAELVVDGLKKTVTISIVENFATETMKEAARIHADLIVATADLDHTIKKFFIGTYIQQIVNHSNIPVLSVRPDIYEENLPG